MTIDIDLQDLLGIEWSGCGCSNPEESACPVCGGKPPYKLPGGAARGGHFRGCWLDEAILGFFNDKG